ncbi:hypothetical protein LV165_008185 [Aspergillus fumigatus]|nr:hypothetical protein LV165_008185 [Aspergillus fumigatus]KAJ8168357.1 hypothetical protein LV162_002052 [Aspergillus fumigatus]
MARSKTKKADIDWNSFVQQSEPKVEDDLAETTKNHIYLLKQNFQKFTSKLQPPDYVYWLKNITLRVIEGFLRWYLDNHNVEYQSGFLVFARYWRVFWCQEMDSLFPYMLRRKMTMLVCTTLTDEYELDLGAKTQPPVNIEDLLYSTYHLVAFCKVRFATVRCRQQLSTLRKMMTSTSARPGTLVLSSGYMRSPDALKWKDIELYMVKHPEDPNCQMLLMRVRHRLNKGKRNKGVAPVFTYTERNDNLGLCVIQDILEYAILDDAFASQRIKRPRDIWLYTHVPDHRLSTPIHFKESVKEIPIFRRAVKDSEGHWITHPTLALQYDQAQEYEIATSRSAGFKNPGSLYKYRKGAARHLDEHSRNVIMGHKRSGTFAYYVQVQDDTQSAFMETPARDALIKLATNSSLTRDASAPQDLSDQRKQELEKDPALISLKGKRDMLRAELIALHHQLRNGRGTDLYREFQRASNKVRLERKKLYRAAKNQEHTEFFENVGNHIIEQNYQGNPISFEPDVSHVVPERKALADLEFKNRDVDKINDAELVEDRIRSLELRLALHNLDVPRALQRRVRFDGPSVDVIAEFPASPKSETGLECPGLDALDSDHALQELLGAFLVRNYVIVKRAEAKNLAAMGRYERRKWLVERH